ncbi:MAG TPA: hypothetical protein VIV60_26060 [Polyangiaceae bacterium]
MANSERTPNADLSGRDATQDVVVEGSRVVPPDYGMPGTKGLASPIRPLIWLLLPFFFCLAYGIMTRGG